MINLISKELQAARIRSGLTRKEVSLKLNVSYETIRKCESGEFNYSLEMVEKLLGLYNVPLEIFFRNICENMHNN
mgnify:FL=1